MTQTLGNQIESGQNEKMKALCDDCDDKGGEFRGTPRINNDASGKSHVRKQNSRTYIGIEEK